MSDGNGDGRVIHLFAAEGDPSYDELLSATVLLWDAEHGIKVRARRGVQPRQVAAWLRHAADHLDPPTEGDH